MSTYELYKKPDGRIVLGDTTPKGCEFMETVAGKHWGAARDTLRKGDYEKFNHKPGYGYYADS